MTRLMKHPMYRDAHGTDDHFMSAMFVAGAAGDEEDRGVKGVMGAETWELVSLKLDCGRDGVADSTTDEHVQFAIYHWIVAVECDGFCLRDQDRC